jgi:hypothetical protein
MESPTQTSSDSSPAHVDNSKARTLASLERIDRNLDGGRLPAWDETCDLVALARWAVENGFPDLSELPALANPTSEDV